MLTRNKVLSHAVLILLLISAFPLIVHVSSGNVSATSADNTWIADGSSSASVAASWENDTLVSGQNIWFTSAHVGACSWNVADSFGTFNIKTYTNTVTQAASFLVTGYSQAAGTFTGSTSFVLSDSGDFSRTAGTITAGTLRLHMTGLNKILTYSATWANQLFAIQFSGNTTVASNTYIGSWVAPNSYITIDTGVTVTLNSGTIMYHFFEPGSVWTNLGILQGAGILRISAHTESQIITFGTIDCPVELLCEGTAADRTFTLGASAIFGSSLTISGWTTYNNNLDLTTSNYALSATDITIGTRGIINGRASTITCSGNWDSSAGTFTAGTSTLVMSGSSKTIKTANTNGALYNFQESGTTTTSSSINITHSPTVDTGKTLTIGAGKTVDLNCSNGGAYSNLGTIAGSGTMEYSFSTADKTLAFGVVNAPVRVRAISTATANRTMTLSSDRVLGSTLLVNSDHASNTMTIDARTVYLGAIGAITEGTRGDILYATFSFVSSPGWGGGVQTGHSYTYETNLSTTASPGQVYTFTSNATWLSWDSTDLAVYGTPDSVFGGHWYYVNISVADGILSTYQNYTVLVVSVETLQDYIPLLMALLFGFGLLIAGLKFRELWILAGPVWIICGLTIFIPYGVVFLLVSVGLGIVLMFKGVSPYL